jgi:hypothetical protein
VNANRFYTASINSAGAAAISSLVWIASSIAAMPHYWDMSGLTSEIVPRLLISIPVLALLYDYTG